MNKTITIDDLKSYIKGDTSIDTLLNLKVLTVRTHKALTRLNVNTAKDIHHVTVSDLLRLPNVGRKTVYEVRQFQNSFAHINVTDEDFIDCVQVMPLSRVDLYFLQDEQFEFVKNYWETNDALPAAFILYHYIITSTVRNDIIKRDRHGLDPDKNPMTLEELGHRFEITRERARQICCKPVKLPECLYMCRSQLRDLFPEEYFCFDLNDFAYITEKENIPGGVHTLANLFSCLFNFVVATSFVPDGTCYIVRRRLLETYPLKIAFKHIDTAFRLSPAAAAKMSLDNLVRINRNKIVFHELEKVFEEYINYHYSDLLQEFDNQVEIETSDILNENSREEESQKLQSDETEFSEEDLLPAFEKFKDAVNNIYVSSKEGESAPHKPIFLLTIIELIRSKKVTENKFPYNELLEDTFKAVWNKFNNRTIYFPNLHSPFTTLVWDGFWKVKTKSDVTRLTNSPSWLKREVEYGYLEEEFYNVLQVTTYRNKLRYAIIKNFSLKNKW